MPHITSETLRLKEWLFALAEDISEVEKETKTAAVEVFKNSKGGSEKNRAEIKSQIKNATDNLLELRKAIREVTRLATAESSPQPTG